MRATIEVDGRLQSGFSGDCLPPNWFDKTAGKGFRQQIDDMFAVISLAEKVFIEEFAIPQEGVFPVWLSASNRVHHCAAQQGYAPLLASFGVSVVERALIDAMCRAADIGFAEAVQLNLFRIVPSEVYPELKSVNLAEALPDRPLHSVFVRHTIGLADPLTAAEISSDERLDDGFPQALDEYLQRTGIRYLKIKVSANLDHDVERVRVIANLAERYLGDTYRVTLDGNEQYQSAAQFVELIDALQHDDDLRALFRNTLAIEQPLERNIALDDSHTQGIRDLCQTKPVIIDESDGTLPAYGKAIQLGYRGVSSKNCKGPIRSLINAALTWFHNQRGARNDYLMTGEDLCSVGVIPVQADLCLAATLGLGHVERNGHHYHRGLSYLPESEQRAALQAHGDFYAEQHGIVSPRLIDGKFKIGSLHCVGFGFDVEPDFGDMQSIDEWEFDSLGLAE